MVIEPLYFQFLNAMHFVLDYNRLVDVAFEYQYTVMMKMPLNRYSFEQNAHVEYLQHFYRQLQKKNEEKNQER